MTKCKKTKIYIKDKWTLIGSFGAMLLMYMEGAYFLTSAVAVSSQVLIAEYFVGMFEVAMFGVYLLFIFPKFFKKRIIEANI